jgi:hypothetical protein
MAVTTIGKRQCRKPLERRHHGDIAIRADDQSYFLSGLDRLLRHPQTAQIGGQLLPYGRHWLGPHIGQKRDGSLRIPRERRSPFQLGEWSSCNAGGFGGHHVAAFPHVAFFLPRTVAAEVMEIAKEADFGLDLVNGGIARLYGRTNYDLHRFGEVAIGRHRARG